MNTANNTFKRHEFSDLRRGEFSDLDLLRMVHEPDVKTLRVSIPVLDQPTDLQPAIRLFDSRDWASKKIIKQRLRDISDVYDKGPSKREVPVQFIAGFLVTVLKKL